MTAVLDSSSRSGDKWLRSVHGFATWWVEAYTRGLPDDRRDRRRREIASDLWEHEYAALDAGDTPMGVGVDLLLRVLRGMAADVTWRRTALRGRHGGVPVIERMLTMLSRIVLGAAMAITALLGAYFVMNGYGIGFGGGGEGGETYPFYGAIEIVSGLLLIAGVLAGSRSPRVAVGMITVGVLVIAVTHVWMLAINIPVAIALVAAAVWRMRTVERRVVAAA